MVLPLSDFCGFGLLPKMVENIPMAISYRD
jgi:hypothetical protein